MKNKKEKKKRIAPKMTKTLWQTMKIAARTWLRPHWKIMAWAIGANFVVGAATGSFPVFIQQTLDILFDANSEVPLYFVSGSVLILLTVRATATYLGNFLNAYAGLRIITSVQFDLFEHFIRSDFHVIGKQHSGKLVGSFMNEARLVDGLVGGQLVLLLRHFITLVGVLAGMIYINWQLSSFFIVALPPVFYTMWLYGRKVRDNFTSSLDDTGDISAKVIDAARGAKIIRAYGTEDRELALAQKIIASLRKKMARVQRAKSASGPSAELLIGFGMAGLFFYVGYQGRSGNFSQGDLVGFITAMLLIYQPLKSLAGAQAGIQLCYAATYRVLERLETKAKIVTLPGTPALRLEGDAPPKIRFKNVFFNYPDTEANVLSDISFAVRPGEIVALVGHSGGGKSTIFNLIERFYDVGQGEIRINGQDTREVSVESLRASMSLVLQDVFLFDNTIASNIAYARSDATMEEIIQASKISQAHEFIEKMPEGYETKVGEGGSILSGGQRQRIAFARAALRDSPILLLDEPTSSLDSESEAALQKGLKDIVKNRTVIIIAHRLSTIQSADRIFVVEKGAIVEKGTHQELLDGNGIYKRLHNTQFMLDGENA